jgi:uncharacterized membrane protein
MLYKNAVVAVFDTHQGAESAVKELQTANFDMKQMSIVAKDYQTDENVVGFYNSGDRMKYWGKIGAFWGGLWGLLFGSGFFLIPGVGPVLVAGHLVTYIVGALEGAAIYGGLTALGAGLYGLGIPKNSVLEYETAVRCNKFLLVAHGTSLEVERVKQILSQSSSTDVKSFELEQAQMAGVK